MIGSACKTVASQSRLAASSFLSYGGHLQLSVIASLPGVFPHGIFENSGPGWMTDFPSQNRVKRHELAVKKMGFIFVLSDHRAIQVDAGKEATSARIGQHL